jgi:hypothetical protein
MLSEDKLRLLDKELSSLRSTGRVLNTSYTRVRHWHLGIIRFSDLELKKLSEYLMERLRQHITRLQCAAPSVNPYENSNTRVGAEAPSLAEGGDGTCRRNSD